MPYQLAALLAATAWACSSLIAAEPVRRLGGPRWCRIRMLWVCAMLTAWATLKGGWASIDTGDLGLLALSGMVGIFVGDAGLFIAMSRIGPRRTSVLFTTNTPMAALGGVFLFHESFTAWSLIGATLTVLGVMLAINFGSGRGVPSDVYERIDGRLRVGVAWATVGAVGQAAGVLAAKPILDAGADTIAVAATRALLATAAMWAVYRPTDRLVRSDTSAPIRRTDHWRFAASGLVAMVVGMTLLLYALANGDTGVATILSGTTPVLLLPILWARTRQPPSPGAWFGAGLTVVGTALLV
ncbi:MAG: DMT family transporter [Acidimicrobiales bacterium]|nr:DMT family transporter [Acidimicrobiales bacterium]